MERPTSICIYPDAFAYRQPPGKRKFNEDEEWKWKSQSLLRNADSGEGHTRTGGRSVYIHIQPIEFNWDSTWVTGPETLYRLVQPVVPFFPCFQLLRLSVPSSFSPIILGLSFRWFLQLRGFKTLNKITNRKKKESKCTYPPFLFFFRWGNSRRYYTRWMEKAERPTTGQMSRISNWNDLNNRPVVKSSSSVPSFLFLLLSFWALLSPFFLFPRSTESILWIKDGAFNNGLISRLFNSFASAVNSQLDPHEWAYQAFWNFQGQKALPVFPESINQSWISVPDMFLWLEIFQTIAGEQKKEKTFPASVFQFSVYGLCKGFNQQLIIHQSTNFSSLFDKKEKSGRGKKMRVGYWINFSLERSRMRR